MTAVHIPVMAGLVRAIPLCEVHRLNREARP
jgi:hypothetical protein